jgi:hypothetical protein
MMDYMISMFIDDELGIDDKAEFVEKVHRLKAFKDETIELLHQEKLIRSQVVDHVPQVEGKVKKWLTFLPLLRPVGLFASALAAAVVILFFSMPSQMTIPTVHRFVIYQPEVDRVDIAGSFTQWRRVPMNRVELSGYWEATLDLPQGEHRFTYILDGRQSFPDPTVLTRETDDFGGENSILLVGL